MKTYNFLKLKELIKKHKANLQEVSLGMHEDWSWTAETIWENGKYVRRLPNNGDELFSEYEEGRKNKDFGLLNVPPKYKKILIGGIYASDWATPTAELIFKNGERKMIECSNGKSKNKKPDAFMLGVLSQPVQDNIPSITDDTDL